MSNYIDLLILLHQKHLLSEEHEKVLLKFLQGQQQTAVDDQVKVILGNFITKIVRKVP